MISVAAVLPVYNVRKYLERCLESVLGQTRPFDQIIIVNDGSTDGSEEICALYATGYTQIELINKPNGGLVSAWKEGLRYVNTSYICFIDSDDYIARDYLETLLNGLSTDIDMVCMSATQAFDTGETRQFLVNGLPEGIYEITDSFKAKMLCDNGAFIRPVASCRWAKLIKTELVREYSEYCSEDISYGEDQQLMAGVLLGCKKLSVLNEYKYYYQYNTASILRTYKKDLWSKIELLMETISKIPGINTIPNFKLQYNTQVLLYFSECLRNESYNRSLSRSKYMQLVSSDYVQNALQYYSDRKMRKIDKKLIQSAKKRDYLMTRIYLALYKILYKLRKVPG